MNRGLFSIRTETDYEAALLAADAFFDAEAEPDPDGPDGACLEALITLIQAYEAKHYPVPRAGPIEAINFRMDRAGLRPAALPPGIGRLNRVYKVLAGTRPADLAGDPPAASGLRHSFVQSHRCGLRECALRKNREGTVPYPHPSEIWFEEFLKPTGITQHRGDMLLHATHFRPQAG